MRGCLLKSETIDNLVPALEAIRRHHRFRSRAITERCEAIGDIAAACATLSRREIELLRLNGEGFSTKEAASELGVSVRTIDAIGFCDPFAGLEWPRNT